MATTEQISALERDGYVVLTDFLSPAVLSQLRRRVDELLAEEGAAAGSEFRHEEGAQRLANLVDKGDIFRQAIAMPEILELVRAVLGPRFKLGSLNMRSANAQSGISQPLHSDMGRVRDEQGYSVCNCVWMLDDFTLENGALRVVPGSHRSGQLPQQVLSEPAAIHPDELLVTGKAGTVVVMNAHAWHGGTANRTDQRRRALHSFFVRYDLPQQQYQKKLLRPETQEALSLQLRALLALDDPLNDELSRQGAGQSGFLK